MIDDSTICAISTPSGSGAIAIIRLSGPDAVNICESLFISAIPGKKLKDQKPNTIHLGTITHNGSPVDEVLVCLFRAPHSYTGEDMIEISCHGSVFIQKEILKSLISSGARMALAGEFTQRAFLHGKLDLSQAEGVADLIMAESAASHRLALSQIRGGFSTEINELRTKLLNVVSLIELELDFSEEDVVFADRDHLKQLLTEIITLVNRLVSSFDLGNVIRTGVPVVIAGAPNVGKSSLLNAILNEERAIVTEIAGTTRDYLEDMITLEGISFRFIDTAGIRESDEKIEKLGIEQTFRKIKEARIIILVLEAITDSIKNIEIINDIQKKISTQKLIIALNKTDLVTDPQASASRILKEYPGIPLFLISAREKTGIQELISGLTGQFDLSSFDNDSVIVTNARHYEALMHTGEAIERLIAGLEQNISNDFLAQDIREAIHYLGLITGTISNDEVLGNIFKSFCIGK
ncbi:MAG: tRNA uridine-5-carboxymethylaminomethyl(34) synthesis GTPase MnmE [Bacteroidia bacterium]|nr:tRNA uridine-5-carboxymethylaminomethyl(34) synthesis GTPase MnmE [Bacteroidia bacterium]